MNTLKRRGISREDVFFVFTSCMFPIFLWSFYKLLNEIPAFIVRLKVSEIIGACAYTLSLAFVESLLFFLVLFLILLPFVIFLPKTLFGNHILAISVLPIVLLSVAAIYLHLQGDQFPRFSNQQILLYVGLAGIGFIVYYLLILRFSGIEKVIQALVRRLSVLSLIYAFFGILSILIVLLRNL